MEHIWRTDTHGVEFFAGGRNNLELIHIPDALK